MASDLVLLPGLICDERLWRDVIVGLDARSIVADLTQDDSIAAMAARTLAAAPARFALAGLSMGGYVALEIMRRAPKRVTHLALLDTSARADDEARRETRRKGIKKVAILAPAFSADCIETLEEIAMQGKETFMEAGGEKFAYIPCLNDSAGGMDMIEAVVRRELSGWL